MQIHKSFNPIWNCAPYNSNGAKQWIENYMIFYIGYTKVLHYTTLHFIYFFCMYVRHIYVSLTFSLVLKVSKFQNEVIGSPKIWTKSLQRKKRWRHKFILYCNLLTFRNTRKNRNLAQPELSLSYSQCSFESLLVLWSDWIP